MLQVPSLGITLVHLSIRSGTIADNTRILAFSGPTSVGTTYTAPVIDISNRVVIGYLVCRRISSSTSCEIAIGHITNNTAVVADFLILSEPYEIPV